MTHSGTTRARVQPEQSASRPLVVEPTRKTGLTPRQRDVLDVICLLHSLNRRNPFFREIAEVLKISVPRVSLIVRQLHDRGHIDAPRYDGIVSIKPRFFAVDDDGTMREAR